MCILFITPQTYKYKASLCFFFTSANWGYINMVCTSHLSTAHHTFSAKRHHDQHNGTNIKWSYLRGSRWSRIVWPRPLACVSRKKAQNGPVFSLLLLYLYFYLHRCHKAATKCSPKWGGEYLNMKPNLSPKWRDNCRPNEVFSPTCRVYSASEMHPSSSRGLVVSAPRSSPASSLSPSSRHLVPTLPDLCLRVRPHWHVICRQVEAVARNTADNTRIQVYWCVCNTVSCSAGNILVTWVDPVRPSTPALWSREGHEGVWGRLGGSCWWRYLVWVSHKEFLGSLA